MQVSKEIEELNDLLRGRWVSGLWNLDHAERQSDPKTRVKPHLWKWQEVYDSLLQAREKISVARGSVERRVIRLVNPGMAETEMTSHTMLLSFQLIQPGEVAPAHRHTMAAFRFILQGKGAYTNVDGQKMVMEEGDLILTPQWAWHEHAHEGDEPMVWIDGLDVPFIQSLQVISFQPYSKGRLPVTEGIDPGSLLWDDATRRRDGCDQDAVSSLPLARYLSFAPEISSRQRKPPRRRRAGIYKPGDRRIDTSDVGLLDSIASPRRAHQNSPTHQHQHLSRVSRQRHDHDQRRAVSLGKRRHFHRAAVVLARARSTALPKKKRFLFSMHDLPILKAFGLYREETQEEAAKTIYLVKNENRPTAPRQS